MSETPAGINKATVLFPRHIAAGARMVGFAGYGMPVQYPEGIVAEHHWTRTHAGLFDVSHMGPCFLQLSAPSGDTEADHRAIAAIIEPLICGDIVGLKPGQVRYTLLLNEEGGIRDDLMVARSARIEHSGTLYIVVNAGTKDSDFALMEQAAEGRATLHRADDGVLLALQGPEAAEVIIAIVPEAANLGFMMYGSYGWNGVRVMISRSGYTGEDGFEILAPAEQAFELWDALLADRRVKPIGLGARDSLRLEAGLPLYGHDLDETTSPIEADLGFAVSKRRREAADFPGAQRILAEREDGAGRVRVGLLVEGAPAREGAEILGADGTVIGRVTSGGYSPSLNRPIALGYVPPAVASAGTSLQVIVRGRAQPATVTKLPFFPHRYVRKATS